MSTYLAKKPSLEDISAKTLYLIGSVSDLGSISSGNLVIAISDIQSGLLAANVFKAVNLTDAETMSVSVVGSNLVFDSSTALTAAKIVEIVIRLN